MVTVESISKILEKEFGIKTPEELQRAVENMEHLDIAQFVAQMPARATA